MRGREGEEGEAEKINFRRLLSLFDQKKEIILDNVKLSLKKKMVSMPLPNLQNNII